VFVQVRHKETGRVYEIPCAQVVVYNDSGQPVSIAYERDDLIVCTDAGQPDYSRTIGELKIGNVKPYAAPAH
jgi:hypothetical protein